MVFFMKNVTFRVLFTEGGTLWERGAKKVPKVQISHPLFGRRFGVVLLKNQILEHLCGICFLAYFWHRFQEARGINLPPCWGHFRRLLRLFCRLLCRCCKSVKLQPLSSETPVFKGARPPLLHTFRYFFAYVFRHAARRTFFADVRFQMGLLWESLFAHFADLA